jgi:redox-sensitive bicupin YhaK (pirin superfamily)
MRSIRKIVKADKVNMGGIILDQPLPHRGIDQISPFLLIHHWDDVLKGGQNPATLGVGPHPHRGFAPVTFIFKGDLHHRDSVGNSSIVAAGGTQWMNSGNGIIHSERPSKELASKGGGFELIQFWVNAPANKKMEKPNYIPLQKEETPVVKSKDGKVNIGVIAGELEGKSSKISTYSPLFVLRIDGQKGGKTEIPIPENFNALTYQLDGHAKVNQAKDSKSRDMVWFKNDGKSIHLEFLDDSRMILLAGEPIDEPLATYGPFVMNTQEELMAAIRDYQSGKMGQLVEDFD